MGKSKSDGRHFERANINYMQRIWAPNDQLSKSAWFISPRSEKFKLSFQRLKDLSNPSYLKGSLSCKSNEIGAMTPTLSASVWSETQINRKHISFSTCLQKWTNGNSHKILQRLLYSEEKLDLLRLASSWSKQAWLVQCDHKITYKFIARFKWSRHM